MNERWSAAMSDHHSAVQGFAGAARSVPSDRWLVPSTPGKWSPAEETLHVVLAYEVGLRSLRGEIDMSPRTAPARARLLRWLVLPMILRSDWFPRARAPREIRPVLDPGAAESAESLIARLHSAAEAVTQELRTAAESGSARRIRHPYFGPLPLLEAFRLMSAHTRHHTRRLAQ
jgi:hypothetical protein